jgi:hypothetical protein
VESSEVIEALRAIDRRDEVSISLCGFDVPTDQFDAEFETNRIDFEKFRSDPWGLINSPNLVVQISGQVYRWKEAAPMLMSSLIYQLPLEQECSPVSLRKDWPKAKKDPKIYLKSEDIRQLGLR